jgi:hypothetical protein
MTFNYAASFQQDKEKWEQFDEFLNELSDTYSEEFEKDIYKKQRFMMIGYKSSPPDIGYAFKDQVPTEIKEQILNKLRELFPERI